jgi:hypothetical protein
MKMNQHKYTGELGELIDKACAGGASDVDFIMGKLRADVSFATTRFVDFALSWVERSDGVARIKYYLFNGNLMQRNYASLFFNRRGDWKYVKQALDSGLIDELQAYSR